MAWGLVREEIRDKTRNIEENSVDNSFGNILLPNKISYFSKGSLKEKEVPFIRSKLIDQMQNEIGGFNHQSYRGKMGIGPAFGKTTIDSMLFWNHSEVCFEDRSERFIELKSMQMAMTKKRIIADMFSTYLLINEHTLYRLIMRNATDRQPLKMLTEAIDEWFPFASLFMSIGNASQSYDRNVLIPYHGGALLGVIKGQKVSRSIDDIRGKTTFADTPATRGVRFTDAVNGRRLSDIPYNSMQMREINGNLIAAALHIKTWIPEAYFSTEQWWIYFQMKALAERFSTELKLSSMIYLQPTMEIPKDIIAEAESRKVEFVEVFSKLFKDRRWAVACKWD